ncbi:sulfotransferase family protein [Acuticoccus kalidii]|uniref:sulfotransferase family protein n=1 Tax=Acuticoccus kalidii TaxID=2910977 RepID=UPI0034E1FAAE
MRSIGNPNWSGKTYWRHLSYPPVWYSNFINQAQLADALPIEFTYDQIKGRYDLAHCPPILTMTLPSLTSNPEKVFDELGRIIPGWQKASVTGQTERLFDYLTLRQKRQMWIERSGLSYWHIPDILSGFPAAKYVHLTRDGRDVVLSMMGMRLFDPIVRFSWLLQSVASRGHLQSYMYFNMRGAARASLLWLTEVERKLTQQHSRRRPYSLPDDMTFEDRLAVYAKFWAQSTRLGLQAIERIPSGQLLTIRYEDLIADPRSTLRVVIEFLRPDGRHEEWLDAVERMPRSRPKRWLELDAETRRAAEEIVAPVNAALRYH